MDERHFTAVCDRRTERLGWPDSGSFGGMLEVIGNARRAFGRLHRSDGWTPTWTDFKDPQPSNDGLHFKHGGMVLTVGQRAIRFHEGIRFAQVKQEPELFDSLR